MPLYVILAAVAVVVSVPLLVTSLRAGSTTARVERNLAADRPVTNLRHIILTSSTLERALRPFADAFAGRARRLTPTGVIGSIERRLELAGIGRTVERHLSAKIMVGLVAATVGVWQFARSPSTGSAVLAGTLILLGYMGPDAALARRARHRQQEIGRQLPDVLDQVSVCVDAGLGFDAALARVARSGRGPLAKELARTLQDVQLGIPRHDAFHHLVDRNDVNGLKQFINAILQAEVYGVPVVRVLRAQAVEQRERRRFHAEAQAQRVPVKLVFPLVLCILPALLLVVLGPGLIRTFESF